MTDKPKNLNLTDPKPELSAQDKLALSIPEAMEISGIGRTLIYDEINAGRLIARKVQKRTLILRSDLEAWLTDLPRAGEPADKPEEEAA